ncbi:MAG TPA: hypothetical protein VHK01_02765 [Lacipirellulaceae bacterium]|nr:hypothetical protein [Lacipirellulaceae bacterium]
MFSFGCGKIQDARRQRANVRNAGAGGTRANQRKSMLRIFIVPADGISAANLGGTENSVPRRFLGSSRTSHGLPVCAQMGVPDVKHNSGSSNKTPPASMVARLIADDPDHNQSVYVSYIAQISDGQGRKLITIDTPSQRVRSSI